MSEREVYAYSRMSRMLGGIEMAIVDALGDIGSVPDPLNGFVAELLSATGDARFHVNNALARHDALAAVE